MVDLCPRAGHGHPDAPAFLYLTVHGSTLLCDEAYRERAPKYHNLVLIDDLQGIPPVQEEERIEIPLFDEGKETTFARVEVANYKGLPVKQTREVFFLKSRFVWVRDWVSFRKPFLCSAGPQWRARQIGPGVGGNYAICFFDILPSCWWGKAREAQRANRLYNPNWNLLVYFLPRPGCDLQIRDESSESLWRNAPQPILYRWRGLGQPGVPLRFDSLLYPHRPSPDPEPVVKGIRLVLEDGDTVVWQVQCTRWRRRNIARVDAIEETLWLVLNPARKSVKAAGLATDASRMFVPVKDGKPTHVYAAEATHVRLNGLTLFESEVVGDVDVTVKSGT